MAEQNGDRFVTFKFLITWGLTLVGIFLGFNYFLVARFDKVLDTKADVAKAAAICDDINDIKNQSAKNGQSIEELKLGVNKMEVLLNQLTTMHSTMKEREDPYSPFYREKKK